MASTLRLTTYAAPVIGALIVSPLLAGTAFAATPATPAASHQRSAAVSAPNDNNSGGPGSVCGGGGRCDGAQNRPATPSEHTWWGGAFGGHWDGGAVTVSGFNGGEGSDAGGHLSGRWDGGAVDVSGLRAGDGDVSGFALRFRH
jgi:hypothetical protein